MESSGDSKLQREMQALMGVGKADFKRGLQAGLDKLEAEMAAVIDKSTDTGLQKYVRARSPPSVCICVELLCFPSRHVPPATPPC